MKYIINLPVAGSLATPESLTALAQTAEDQGVEAISSSERLLLPRIVNSRYPYGDSGEFPDGEISQKTLEMITTLAFLCGKTSRIHLLTSVLVLPYRNPILTAKMLATLDFLSKGRLIVGCGVGWMREEFEALGLPTHFRHRGRISDEYIQGIQELWCQNDPAFQGDYLNFSEIDFAPKPAQRPHPPLWFGGESPAALRRVAKYGNGWMPISGNPRYPLDNNLQLADAIQNLRQLLESGGRNPDDVQIRFGGTWSDHPIEHKAGVRQPLSGSPHQVAKDIRLYESLGVSYMSVNLITENLFSSLKRIERFMTQVAPMV